MKRSSIADEIARDLALEQYYKKKVARQKCLVNNEKQCIKCKYQNNCIDMEENNEVD